jgi:hypothetical protein
VASNGTNPQPSAALRPDGTPIRLAPGAHSSPQEGVCVVELASVIAREKFSDRPRCVCPVIGAFLRGWNDRAPHAERQRLGPYAAYIVGSRNVARVTRQRRDICLEWAGADLAHGTARRLLNIAGMRLRIAVYCGLAAGLRLSEGAGDYASRVASVRGDPDAAFELLDRLLAVGRDQPPTPAAVTLNGYVPPTANGNGRPPGASRNGHPPAGTEPLQPTEEIAPTEPSLR